MRGILPVFPSCRDPVLNVKRGDPVRRAVSLPRALSKLGLCSRTQAFDYIGAGRVAVNGHVSMDSSLRVSLEADRISVDGLEASENREPVVMALHKPVGYVTTRSDPQGRPTIYDLLPKVDRFFFPVGRLDMETSGLLIVTDDHRLGEALTSPESHIPKTYEVVLDRQPDDSQLSALRSGLTIGRGEVTRKARVGTFIAAQEEPAIRMTIGEGKNRQVRRMVAKVGLSVVRLSRVSIGNYHLGDLVSGGTRLLSQRERSLLLTSTYRTG